MYCKMESMLSHLISLNIGEFLLQWSLEPAPSIDPS